MTVQNLTQTLDMADLWQTCLLFEYDRRRLVDGIASWLETVPHERVLDCACGSGFPALDLIAAGFSITCSDGSIRMLSKFERAAAAAGLRVTPHLVLWRELTTFFEPHFDVVMCRGSSLIYAGAWDDRAEPNPDAIAEAIRNFAATVRPGGIVYLDTTSAENLRTEIERNKYPTRIIDGHSVLLSEIIRTDRSRHIRTWSSQLTVDGEVFEFERHSYYLPHDHLARMMTAAGLTDVQQLRIDGEHYDVFAGRRPL
jgi:SAM-dependent methyltransferase